MTNFLIAFLTLTVFNMQGQKHFEKEIAYKEQSVEVELNFASSIEIISWDRADIKIQADVSTNDEKYTDLFRLDVEESTGMLKISSNSKELFEAYQEDRNMSDSGVIFSKGMDHEFNYKLYLPKNIKLNISSITGNINADYLEGNITADLVSGDIKIKKFNGNLKLTTVNGRMELPGNNTSVKAKTVIGNIQASEELAFTRKDKFLGEEIEFLNKSSKNSLELHSVSGEIIIN